MQNLRYDILSKLAYFDIFSYPLTKDELYAYLHVKSDFHERETALQQLLLAGKVFRVDEFYSLRDDQGLAARRRKGNRMAESQLKIAKRAARWLSWFPYVRGVAVSGSLSKNYADEHSDIDFFIITASNRLWIARSFMHFFKKITFLFGRQHWFCMNYYIDEEALEIKEKNIFTAMEVTTVLPLQGEMIFDRFLTANGWITKYFSSHTLRMESTREMRSNVAKWCIEKFFNNRAGDRLEKYLMTVTATRWNKKTARQERNMRGLLMGMDAGQHYAKPEPKYFQEKVVALYKLKLAELQHEAAVAV